MRSIGLISATLLLMVGCLAGCSEASPGGTAAVNVLPVRPADPAVEARVAAAAIDIGAAEDLFNAADRDLSASDFSRLDRDAVQLHDLPVSDLNSNIVWQRQQEINQVGQAIVHNWANKWLTNNQITLIQKAGAAAQSATKKANANFKKALSEVTEDAIRSLTCQQILNSATLVLGPGGTSQSDAEDWTGDITEDADQLLAGTFNLNGIAQVMEWVSWYKDVTNAAAQASTAILNNPNPYLNILFTPAGQRAALVFAKYCYAPPAFNESP